VEQMIGSRREGGLAGCPAEPDFFVSPVPPGRFGRSREIAAAVL